MKQKVFMTRTFGMLLATILLFGNAMPHVYASGLNTVSGNDALQMTTFNLGARNAENSEWHELEEQTVAVWDRTDIVLTSSKTYENPYLDVEVEAVFTHIDGTEIKLSGFWNGDNEWRVRFAPTLEGTWSYVITSNQTEDIATEEFTGLHNVKGSISAYQAAEGEISNPNLLHGFLEFSDNNRYFQYADGTPFYWLGDTQWQAPNYVSITQCNYPGCDCENQFEHEVQDRIEKGFTVYQTYFDSAEADGGGQRATTSEPSMWNSRNNVSASSRSASDHNPDKAIDGKENTYWCASDGTFPQWIAVDLGEKETFNHLKLRT